VIKNENILIRLPNISDLEDIVSINRISLPENYSVAHFVELINSWQDTSCVALLDNKVVGYILMRIVGPGFFTLNKSQKSKGHIISVAVLPDARRKGIGIKMMKFVMEKAKNIALVNEITLEVRESNYEARNLYKKLNFIDEKVLKQYYSDGENAILMKLNL